MMAMRVLLLTGFTCSGFATAPSAMCQAQMDAFCNNHSHCANYPSHGTYYARFDTNKGHDAKAWRCYPASALSLDQSHYVNPGTKHQGICTKRELGHILDECEAPGNKTFITTVFKGGQGGCVMYRTPSLLRVANGTLLAFTQCRQKSHADSSAQEIHLKLSHDHGSTWTASRVLPFAADPDFTTQHRASTVYDEKTGAIFLFDDARPIGNSGTCAVQIWRTDDLGASWKSVQNLTDNAKNLTGSALATGIQLPSGKLIICMRAGCNGRKNRPYGDHALWSEDHGVTWQAGARMSNGTNECQLAPLTNGSLIANSRTPSKKRLVSISNDEGRSWSPARVEPALSGYATVHASLLSYQGQLFFSHPEAGKRSHLTIRRSRDDGNTWPQNQEDSVLIWAGPSAYSSLGSTADGALAVLWEKDSHDLGFAKTFAFSEAATEVDVIVA